MFGAKDGFPAIGHTYEANFGADLVFHLNFNAETAMTLTRVGGQNEGTTESELINVTPLRPGVFQVTWHERRTGRTVVQVQDFENEVVYANITLPNDNNPDRTELIRLKGTFKWLA